MLIQRKNNIFRDDFPTNQFMPKRVLSITVVHDVLYPQII
jgi:hypothetical protein